MLKNIFKTLLRSVPGFSRIHIFWYPKDLSIPPNDPERGSQNQEMKAFPTYLGMAWFVANDPTARAAFHANRFRYLVTPRSEVTEVMLKGSRAAS